MSVGKILAIEGIDGSGKTELLNRLQEHFGKNPEKIIFANIYNDKAFTNELEIIAKENCSTRRKMFSASIRNMVWFNDLLNNFYKDYLIPYQNGKTIIFDRYKLSNSVFTEFYDLLNFQFYEHVRENLPKENIIIYLDVNLDVALHRIKERGKEVDSYETLNSLKRIKLIYEKQLQKKENVYIINANQNIDKVLSDVLTFINK